MWAALYSTATSSGAPSTSRCAALSAALPSHAEQHALTSRCLRMDTAFLMRWYRSSGISGARPAGGGGEGGGPRRARRRATSTSRRATRDMRQPGYDRAAFAGWARAKCASQPQGCDRATLAGGRRAGTRAGTGAAGRAGSSAARLPRLQAERTWWRHLAQGAWQAAAAAGGTAHYMLGCGRPQQQRSAGAAKDRGALAQPGRRSRPASQCQNTGSRQ